MSYYNLPGIVSVEYSPAGQTTFTPDKHLIPGDTIAASGTFTALPLVGLASCSTNNERTDAGLIYTTVLSCLLTDDEDLTAAENTLSEAFHVYRIKDVYGKYALIGANEMPYPEINFNPQNDGVPAGIRGKNVEIRWISTLPPVPLN